MQPFLTHHGSQAAKDASASQDKLIDLFNRIEHFFGRLEIYTGITPTAAMTGIIIEIMVEVLTILAIATKEVRRGRLSELMLRRFTIHDSCYLEKYIRKLTGNSEIEDSLDKLDKLTQDEVRMAAAELLKITHSVEENVQDVRDNVQDIDNKVQGIGSDVKDISSEIRGVDDKLDQVNSSLSL